ncbi:MAG: helix-turn-helix domain-containing protein [Clostridia bacterium]|nr:helix-turn-helix domain-containing protein [Clostridia bacterium]
MTIGKNISTLRKRAMLALADIADRVGVNKETVKAWEADESTPTLEQLLKLKDVFDISLDRLVTGEEPKRTTYNTESLDTICASLCYAFGIEPPKTAADKNPQLADYIDKIFDGGKADRVVMYNPDAIGQWVMQKYPGYVRQAKRHADIEIPLATVMPSVTPVCFATMYTGAQPEIHGIKQYEKPVVKIETLFDALIKAGKKPAIITYANCSLSKIFKERNMDYYYFDDDDGAIEQVNALAAELILKDQYDFLLIYNENFDSAMHKNGPENARTLAELRVNAHAFSVISNLIEKHWKHHNTLVGFAMDHGCHEIDGECGSHGLYMPEDINILHLYKGYKREEN